MPTPQDRKSNLNQLERVREIHRLIRRFTDNPENESLRVTDESLAQALHVSSRQARRDREVLIRLIDEKDLERGHGGEECALQFDKKSLSWRYMREIDLSVWVGRLDDEELGSLLVAQQALAVFSGMPLAKHIGHIFEEDAGGLVGNSRSALQEDITKLISFYPDGAGKIDQDHFATIFRGLLLSQQLEVSYQSKVSAVPKVRVLRPYHLCCFKHQWRLIAHDSQYDAIRDFVVTPRRLKSVKLLSRPFKRPADFNAHEHLSRHKDHQTQQITLRIAPAGAHHVQERNWYGLSSTKELEGGAIEAVFKVGDLNEFKRFVLAFGSDCEVLEPATFREQIHEEAQGVLAQGNYGLGKLSSEPGQLVSGMFSYVGRIMNPPTESEFQTPGAANTNREVMNGKPVIEVEAKSVINFASAFSHKLLCDGLTFSTGSACAYSCSFCYVKDLMRKNPHGLAHPESHAAIVVRRRGAVDRIRKQLTYKDGRPKFMKPEDRRVIYSSPLVDVAANMDLVRESVEACRAICELTNWHIRLLSKSNLLPKIAEALKDFKERMIFGVSTGTLDDDLAVAFEEGTPKVSKRIQSLHWLQDHGFRTFGMICPSLPLAKQTDYLVFAENCAKALRAEKCEHVWAEVINVRGESMLRTCAALRAAGFMEEAARLERVSADKAAWEEYARQTFEGHASVYQNQPGKLRFLQYANKASRRSYWEAKQAAGAVLL